MSSRHQENPEFCADLREEIDRRIAELIDSPDVALSDKFTRLKHIASTHHFSLGDSLSRIEHAAQDQTPVAAFVECPVVPCTDGVFLGYLRPDDPLEFDEDGFAINITRGQIARVHTEGDFGRLRVSSRYTTRDDEANPVGVQDRRLQIIRNDIPSRYSLFSARADAILDTVTGLDFKVTFPGANLPIVEDTGEVSGRMYDRMNVVRGLGESTFKAMWASLATPEQTAS